MKFLIFCWHNTTNFNIMERERTHTHRAWKMIYCTHTHTEGERETIEGHRYKDKL